MKKILLCCLMFASSVAFAGRSVDAKIVNIRVDSSGLGMIHFDSPITGTVPGCINAVYTNALSFNTNTNGGKSVYAAALAAKAAGTAIIAYGAGVCANYNGAHVEDVDYLIMR